MEPSECFPPDDPREWLNRARSKLASARNRISDSYLEALCFEAQYAARTAIKTVMVRRGIDMPYVHNSALLLSILDGIGGNVPHTVHRAARLTTVCREYTRFKRRAGCIRTGVPGRQRVVTRR